ncbi:DNA-directed RNA polymerase I and III subunit RPAC2 [Polytolypa hystricis UAMH7299]|uniref:DNA-directed RNA polymerase I and III subunit RPAC2 n=1 Tax=Polytolypa hystricis (strain UAMH7299) TaxID=1447883 RepID=A0A2B7X581_POLH7|nr:DNA-directed RNA polymerase I and III subunit RPAC2 [Polytolypa hystricis UAMH7299]
MPSSVHSQDQSMLDVDPQVPEQQAEEDEAAGILDEQRITILPGALETAASFQFEGEDHTLGNALRYVIMKNPEVEFCGYTIPHPSEAKMNLRIQTYDTTTVFEVLRKGLDDLMDLCDVVTEKFTVARDGFDAEKMQ